MNMQNWYQKYKEETLNKEAGFKDFMFGSLLTAIGMILFQNYSPEDVSKMFNLKINEVQHALHETKNNPDLMEQVKEEINKDSTKPETNIEYATNLNIIARTIWAEAKTEDENGMRGVASVIYNRGNGTTGGMISAIKKPKQFSCWNSMDWNKFTIKEKSGAKWNIAKQIAQELLDGNFSPTTSANHYYNPSLANPQWAYDKKGNLLPYDKIGNHNFLKL